MELTADAQAVPVLPAAPPLRAELPRPPPPRTLRRRPLHGLRRTAHPRRSRRRSPQEIGREVALPRRGDRRRPPGGASGSLSCSTNPKGGHTMQSIPREDVPVVIEDNGVEVRLRDEDGLSVGFVRLPAGADLRPATKGLPNDLCPCPHWGYMIKGRVRMHTRGRASGLRRRRSVLLGSRPCSRGARGLRVRRFLTDRGVPAGDRAHHVRGRSIRVIRTPAALRSGFLMRWRVIGTKGTSMGNEVLCIGLLGVFSDQRRR